MSKRTNKIFSLVSSLLILVIGSVNCEEFESQPKIRTINGNLIIEAVKDRNISFNLLKGSSLFVNDTDVYENVKDVLTLKVKLSENAKTFEQFDEQNVKKQLKEFWDILSLLRSSIINLNRRIPKRQISAALTDLRRVKLRVGLLEMLLNTDQCLITSSGRSPCKNGGICYNTFPKFYCDCLEGWTGITCDEDIDECREFAGTDLGCQNNAFCENTRGSYRCKCRKGYFGTHCRSKSNVCESGQSHELCGHGVCVHDSNTFGYSCICDAGWTKNNATPSCTVDVDECEEHKNPCHNECINLPGTFRCGPCPQGYTGNGLTCMDINECDYENGGCSEHPFVKCINSEGSYHCGNCPQGWTGDGRQCEKNPTNSCDNEKICHPRARCEYISDAVVCTCPMGMYGHGFGLNGCTEILQNDPCERHQCKNNGTCVVNGRGTTCVCPIGFTGYMCEENDECHPSPCQNGGTCSLGYQGYRCSCEKSFTGKKCEIVREICDSIIRESEGELSYPADNSSYQAHENCPWIIITHPSKILNVSFSRFDLERSTPDCHKDFLQIHDGPRIDSQLIGRFCGNELPLGGNILSSHQKMLFWFHSDKTNHGGGFKFNWISQNYVCGDEIDISTSGVIKSPGYPDKTPINRNCEWKLTAKYGYRVVLRIYEINLGNRANCSGDTLKIYDSDLELKTFCQSGTTDLLWSSSNKIRVHFHTDEYSVDSNFQMHYEVEHAMPHCGGLFTEPTGVISGYVNAFVCLYLIRQPNGTQIQLDLDPFQLSNSVSCHFQKLQIFDGDSDEDPLIKQYCGNQNNLEPIKSTGNTLLLKYENFYKNLPLPNKFKANYKRICEYSFFGPDGGEVSTPNYPNAYLKGLTCTYDLYGPANYGVGVEILDFSMDVRTPNTVSSNSTTQNPLESVEENTNYFDVIEFGSLRQRYYGNPPMKINSFRNNHLRLVLHMAQHNLKARGLKFSYKFYRYICGGILTEDKGSFKITVSYHNDCQWIIKSPQDRNIRLRFGIEDIFELVNKSNYGKCCIFIYDNSTSNEGEGQLLQNYCEDGNFDDVYATNFITIQMPKQDKIFVKRLSVDYDFIIKNETCGGEFKTKFGIIKSPYWPKSYGVSKNCTWHIIAPMGHQIELKVHNFSIEEEFFDCVGDFLQINNGPNEKSPLIGKYCGVNIPKRIPSLSNHLYITFLSDEYFVGDGFYITWEQTATGCGGKLNSHEGSIHSPHNQMSDTGEVACDWEIIVAKGSTVILKLQGLDVCHKNHLLTIYDGINNAENKLEPNCTIENSTYTLQSTTNEVLVRYIGQNDEMNNMQFVIDYETNCKIVLDNIKGVIESPNFPDNYPSNLRCSWDIRAGKNNQISIAFSHLNVERGYFDCNYDYLDYIDMRDDVILGEKRLCRIPTDMLITQGNHAILKFVSDHSRSRIGFRLEYKRLGCGEHIFKHYGTISTPNAPFSIDMDCEWYFEVEAGYRINLVFTELKISTDTPNCTHDGILVKESKTSNVELLRDCTVNDMVISKMSPSNRLYVHFYTNERRTKKYFSASFTTSKSVCGGSYYSNSGYIASPSLSDIHGGIECQWDIKVEKGYRVLLRFKEFNMTKSTNCTTDYLKFTDYVDNKEVEIARFCEEENTPLVSRNNYVGITLKISDKGWGKFDLYYEKECGGYLSSPSGFIKSQTDRTCTWLLYATNGYITLDILQLECVNVSNNGLMVQSLQGYEQKFCNEHHSHIMIPGENIYFTSKHINFRAKYSTVLNSCGGKLNSLSGLIASPLYPQEYPANIECIWKIEASDTYIEINLMEIDIRESENCNEDFLEVRNSEGGKLMGLFCGTSIPDEGLRLFEDAWIKFRSIDTGTGKGFKLSYNFAHNNELNGTRGTIKSPPLYGISDVEPFSWRILVLKDQNIQLDFQEYNVGLELYDGYDESGLSVEILPSPWIFTSSSNVVYLRTNNVNIEDFKIVWHIVNKNVVAANASIQECHESITLGYQAMVNLSSPGYPKEYKSDMHCEWIIKTENIGEHVVLEIYDIDLENTTSCYADYLKVWTSSDLEEWTNVLHECHIIGSMINSVRKIHGTPYIKVEFHSDDLSVEKGFTSKLTTACGSNITTSVGRISHSNRLRFTTDEKCLWKISVRPGRRITMNINFINMKLALKTCESYALIYNGIDEHAPLLTPHRICSPFVLESSSNQITLSLFKKDLYLWTFNFTFREINNCNDEIRLTDYLPTVNISSPRYPNVPQPHTECNWLIIAPVGEILEATFVDSFDLNVRYCQLEYVEIYDGSTSLARKLGKFCRKPSKTIRSTGNLLKLHYLTEIAEPRNGFRVNISIAKCGGAYTQMRGEIISKNYPELEYKPKSAFCDYTINVYRQNSHISLNFTDFDLPYNASKVETSDRIEIITLNDLSSTTKQVLYGNLTTLPVIEIEENKVLLRFYTFPKVNKYRGFKLKYSRIMLPGCSRYVKGESGKLVLKSIFRGYSKCYWQITVPKGQSVNLTSSEIIVSNASLGLFKPRIIAYNDIERISKIAEYDLTTINSFSIISSDNIMYVDVAINTGFKKLEARYSSDMDSPCPQSIENYNSGYLFLTPELRALPNYNCRIEFGLNGEETMSVKIIKLQMIFITSKAQYPVVFNDDFLGRSLYKINSSITNTLVSISPTRGSLSLYQNEKVSLSYFRAEYRRHNCGGYFYVSDALHLKKPAIDNNKYGVLECVWTVNVGFREYKLLGNVTFTDNCDVEYISIYSRISRDTLITKLCKDNAVLSELISQKYYVVIIYHADNYKSLLNMDIKLEKTLSCGSITKVHDFDDLDIDKKSYKNNIECSWEFVAPTGYYLSVTFSGRFFIEDAVNCTKDYLEIQIYKNGLWHSQYKLCGRELPYLTIHNSRIRAIFHTNEAVTGDGFHMGISAECNVKVNVTEEPQILFSPLYSLDNECNYEFFTNSNSLIHLEINGKKNDVENYENCNDFTAFTEYLNQTIESGEYCVGSEIHAHHYLRLELKATESITFNITYNLVSCGGNITNPTTVYSLPAANMLKDEYCQWNIMAPSQHAVIIRFLKYKASKYLSQCKLFYVAIFEGLTTSADKRILKLCGQLKNNIFIINTNEATLTTYKHQKRAYNSFEAEIIFTKNCNEYVTLSEDNNMITIAQNHQLNVTEERFCHYYITAPEGNRVSFIIKSLNINNQSCSSATCQNCNYIEIFDDMNGDTSIGKYCAKSGKSNYKVYSSYENALIRLYVKNENQYSFEISTQLEYSLCGGKNMIYLNESNENSTTIAFPQGNMSTYPPNTHCMWKINSEIDYEIDFEWFLLQNVSQIDGECKDYLYVNSISSTYTHFCGNATGHQMVVFASIFSNPTEIIFHSDELYEDKGFNLTIRPLRTCGRIFTKLSDVLFVRSDSCSLEIHVPDNYTLSIFVNQCHYITVKAIDINKNETLQTNCAGNTMNIFTKTNRVQLEGTSLNFVTISYIASDRRLPPGCGGVINKNGILFTNPPYDQGHNFSQCRWDIIVPAPNNVLIRFLEFDMGPKNNCDLDYMQILEIQPDGTESISETLCGAESHRDFKSNTNHIAIISTKSPNFSGIGWELKHLGSRMI